MKNKLIPASCFFIYSCSSTPTAKWDKETAAKSCFDVATKAKYDLDDVQIKKVRSICDCVGEKMTTAFKTEKEANDKMLDAAAIANECKDEFGKIK